MNKVQFLKNLESAAIKFNKRAAQKGLTTTMNIERSGDLIKKTIERDGLKRTSFFDLNGNLLGINQATERGTFSTLYGDGYISQYARLNSKCTGLERIKLTNNERTTYAEARKFYNDGLEWRGLEGEYDDMVHFIKSSPVQSQTADCIKTLNGSITNNSWSKGQGLKDFNMQEEHSVMGLAKAKLSYKDLPRRSYYSTTPQQEIALDNQLKNDIHIILNG